MGRCAEENNTRSAYSIIPLDYVYGLTFGGKWYRSGGPNQRTDIDTRSKSSELSEVRCKSVCCVLFYLFCPMPVQTEIHTFERFRPASVPPPRFVTLSDVAWVLMLRNSSWSSFAVWRKRGQMGGYVYRNNTSPNKLILHPWEHVFSASSRAIWRSTKLPPRCALVASQYAQRYDHNWITFESFGNARSLTDYDVIVNSLAHAPMPRAEWCCVGLLCCILCHCASLCFC